MTIPDDLTWTRAKNALLMGAAGLVVIIAFNIAADISSTRKDCADIKVTLAAHEARVIALAAEEADLRAQVMEHFREDRAQFKKVVK